jgi:hypothetical protein
MTARQQNTENGITSKEYGSISGQTAAKIRKKQK